ncbi:MULTISPECIES: hypothetical protein [Sphingomonadales]|jgi:hypothetical protein|uniref:Uncharacterized protein n=1 Tax=Hephaestia caeni TaxID=645617 RepID=A0A397PFM7_9SPHN|nr:MULTISPECIES: hypothetical protein [Sphingomonadaceae]RIA46045.1 hypothetical protein DFR49_0574 [Hephaestia caeni]WQE08104.1 hypothetical protein U0025_04250 [Sphingobium yanoikuyae]
MMIPDLSTAEPKELAPVLLAAIQRLGQLGRTAAVEVAALVDDQDADFEEAASWIADIAAGELRD